MNKIEHIGIAVKNMAESSMLFEKLLGVSAYKSEEVLSESVLTSFFKTDSTKIELLAATHPESSIAKFIEKKGEEIHHLAFAVADLETEIKRLKNEGFVFIDETPKRGADNKRIVFLHPKSSNGILIELCQEIN